MELYAPSTFQFELVIGDKHIDEGLGVPHTECKVIHVNAYVLIDVTITFEPDVRFCPARCETKAPQYDR